MARTKRKRHKKVTLFNSIEQVQQELYRPSIGFRVLVGILVIAVILIGNVWQKVTVSELAQDIEKLEKLKQTIEEKNGYLNSEKHKLTDVQRIVGIAGKKIGMVFPKTELVPLKVQYRESDLGQ